MVCALALTASSSAWAMGMMQTKSGPPSGGFSKYPVIENHASALKRSWKQVEESWDKDYQTLSGAADRFEVSLKEAEKSRLAASNALIDLQRQIDAENKQIDQWSAEQTGLRKKAIDPNADAEKLDAEIAKLEGQMKSGRDKVRELDGRAKEFKAQEAAAVAAAGQIRAQINQHSQESYGQDLKGLKDSDVGGAVKKLSESVLKDRKLRHVEKVTDELFDALRDDYMKSEFLVSDLERLKAEYGFAGEKMEMLKNAVDKRMNNTLLGNFVNEQITKAMTSMCQNRKFQEACAAEKADALPAILRDILKEKRPTSFITDREVKRVESVRGPYEVTADPTARTAR